MLRGFRRTVGVPRDCSVSCCRRGVLVRLRSIRVLLHLLLRRRRHRPCFCLADWSSYHPTVRSTIKDCAFPYVLCGSGWRAAGGVMSSGCAASRCGSTSGCGVRAGAAGDAAAFPDVVGALIRLQRLGGARQWNALGCGEWMRNGRGPCRGPCGMVVACQPRDLLVDERAGGSVEKWHGLAGVLWWRWRWRTGSGCVRARWGGVGGLGSSC